ncbi:hypothetical protein ABUE31_15150 [Mesorhizobium sp. ZMM04-5]|uniref:Uncharacterized protein n=1 Tax=Mesorhizobium marinum TaxID=3228790 RepID=A0ABV3R1V8_9HYPH
MAALACFAATPAGAVPAMPQRLPDAAGYLLPVVSSTIVRRDGAQDGGGAWKKRRHRRNHHDGEGAGRGYRGDSHSARRGDDSRAKLYRPRATQKFAYDAYGNLRVYDGDGWDADDNRRGRHSAEHRHRQPRIEYRGPGYRKPSRELRRILTTVPDLP